MNEEKYELYDELGNLIGSYLTKSNALLLLSALFTKYYNDDQLKITMSKMRLETEANDE